MHWPNSQSNKSLDHTFLGVFTVFDPLLTGSNDKKIWFNFDNKKKKNLRLIDYYYTTSLNKKYFISFYFKGFNRKINSYDGFICILF